MKEETIRKLTGAALVDDWYYDIIEGIPDLFARGYLSSRLGPLLDSYGATSEDFREELIEIAGWDIWGRR